MAKIKYSVLTTVAFTAGAGNALANNANTDPAGPARVVLITLEKSAYEAWKSKDAKFWEAFLSDKFVGWGSTRLEKVSATKEDTGTDCDIKSDALPDEQISPLGKSAARLTDTASADCTCGGHVIPGPRRAAR